MSRLPGTPDRTPTVSVVISTHDRRASLLRALTSLAGQTWPARDMEIVVVANGCADDTAAAARAHPMPCEVRVVVQADEGPPGGRNAGARVARGRLLIFLDDDVEATAGLVRAHVDSHDATEPRAVIGFLPPAYPAPPTLMQAAARLWWLRFFSRISRPGHRFAYSDLVSGNVSIAADVFHRVGGFTTGFRCRDDFELGVRLLAAGVRLRCEPRAEGAHHDVIDVDRACARKYAEGRADVRLGVLHPELRSTLTLARTRAITGRGAGAVSAGERQRLAVLERLRARGRWQRAVERLMARAYWSGVADALGSLDALPAYLAGGVRREVDEIDLDLRDGLAVAERRLDETRPHGARLHHGGMPIGHLPARPGLERLRGEHLRPALAGDLGVALLHATTLERARETVAA